MAEVKPAIETFAKIKVIGVGGSGGSAINRMIKTKIKGVEFIAVNTDVQALHYSHAPVKLHLGRGVTRGLGAGMNPELGKASAEESQNEIRDALKGADMVFVTCGLGGGTGSGAAPIVAEIARDLGALTVAVVTKPFAFEGAQRAAIAESALDKIAANVDTLISIPNDRILHVVDKKTSLLDAFEVVDDVLRQAVQGISELITVPGLINVDFADIRAIMTGAGSSLMGIGRASGEQRAVEAAKQAITSPLLELSIDGAQGVLFTFTGSPDMSMHEVTEAAQIITANTDENAKVIFGAVINEALKDEVKICVIATGFDEVKRSMCGGDQQAESGFYSVNRFLGKSQAPEGAQGFDKEGSWPKSKVKKQAAVTDEEEKEDEKTSFVKRSVAVAKGAISLGKEPAVAGAVDDDEDLEIPAFLRRNKE